MRTLKEWLLLRLLGPRLDGLDEAGGYMFARDGKLMRCKLCNGLMPLPGVMIPHEIRAKPGSPLSPEGKPYETEVVYRSYHRACAVLCLLRKPDLSRFIHIDQRKDEDGDKA